MEILAQASSPGLSGEMAGIVIFIFLAFTAAIGWWQLSLKREFKVALEMFQMNPSDKGAEKRLVDAARYRADDGKSSVDVARLIQEQLEIRQRELGGKSKFVAELATLVDIHKRGGLTDEEFDRAKTKLLD